MKTTEYISVKNRIFLEVALFAISGLVANDNIISSKKKVEIMEILYEWKDKLSRKLEIEDE